MTVTEADKIDHIARLVAALDIAIVGAGLPARDEAALHSLASDIEDRLERLTAERVEAPND